MRNSQLILTGGLLLLVGGIFGLIVPIVGGNAGTVLQSIGTLSIPYGIATSGAGYFQSSRKRKIHFRD